MAKKLTKNTNYVIPLNMNGLQGRMFKYSSKKKLPLDILLVYGHHASLEGYKGLIQFLYSYGNLTVPDLPGLGGMDSFYKIGKKPSIDNYAAYLASFMKMQFKRKKIVIVGFGFGFVVVTRMLQRYPGLQKNVKLIIALKGYSDDDDFKLTKAQKYQYRAVAKILSYRSMAIVARKALLNGPMLKLAYLSVPVAKEKIQLDRLNTKKSNAVLQSEISLWQINDVRTYMFCVNEMTAFTNCDKRIDLPVWHLVHSNDQLIDNSRAEQHLKVIFAEYRHFKASGKILPVFNERKSVTAWFPKNLKKELRNI